MKVEIGVVIFTPRRMKNWNVYVFKTVEIRPFSLTPRRLQNVNTSIISRNKKINLGHWLKYRRILIDLN